jgi:hypothetical protein
MTSPLTPAEIIKDIQSLDRMIHDWNAEGRLDWDTDAYLKARKAELMDLLRDRFHTEEHEWWTGKGDRWVAWNGEPDGDYDDDAGRWMPTVKYAYGPTEIGAIEQLLEMIGEDVDA